jgi:cysteinyl-tRNA synthetase
MVVRLFLSQAQYRKPVDFTEEAIAATQNGWQTLKEGLLFGYQHGSQLGWTDVDDESFGDPSAMRIPDDSEPVQRFRDAMDDDLNTSGGLAVLFELAKELQKEGNRLVHEGKVLTDSETLRSHWQTLVCLSQVLGLEAKPDTNAAPASGLSDAEIATLIQQRLDARKAKNWAESDRIRDELKAQDITLIDKPGNVTDWHRG